MTPLYSPLQAVLPPLPRFAPMPLPPRVSPSKQPMRLALSERLAHNPLQPFVPARMGWQHAQALKSGEAAGYPIGLHDLWQGELQTNQLLALLNFVGLCTRSTDRSLFFRQTSKGFFLKELGNLLTVVLPAISGLSRVDCSDLIFAPSIETACCAFVKVGLDRVSVDFSQPWQFTHPPLKTLLEDLGDMIRDHQRSASAGRTLERHDEYHRSRLRETKRYFSKLSRVHPTGYLIRVELEVASGGSADPQTRFIHMHRSSGDFIRRVKATYGGALVGDARLIDRAGGNGYQAHALLVIDGPSHQETLDIEQALPGIWREIAPTGQLRDTNILPNFQYRGTGSEYRDYDSLASQLAKAVVYMATTGEIFRVQSTGALNDLVLAEVSDIDPQRRK